jgi:hypothetical protein
VSKARLRWAASPEPKVRAFDDISEAISGVGEHRTLKDSPAEDFITAIAPDEKTPLFWTYCLYINPRGQADVDNDVSLAQRVRGRVRVFSPSILGTIVAQCRRNPYTTRSTQRSVSH